MIETHTIVKNGEDFIEPCLKQVLPHVKYARVILDDSSTDGTRSILAKLQKEYSNLKVDTFTKTPGRELIDLGDARNKLLKSATEKWIWILDDDEYYPTEQIESILRTLKNGEYNAYALRFYFLIDYERCHGRKSNRYTERFFLNTPKLRWEGKWGEEHLMDGEERLWHKVNPNVGMLPNRYVHFSYLKKSSWRRDFNLWPYPDYGESKCYEIPKEFL